MPIPASVRTFLAQQGYPDIQSATALAGGCINQAFRLHLVDGRLLCVKTHPSPPPGFFAAEAHGLGALGDTAAVRVPVVLAVGEHCLVLEWLDGARGPHYWAQLGHQLAHVHQHTADTFGFSEDNYCGLTPQPNPAMADGYGFFATARLQYQARRAREAGLLAGSDLRRVDRISERLADWVPRQPASLIHGDLWGGNVHCGPEGEPVLIDPAAHYGWREAELAMTTLFGGFPEAFYQAYLANSTCEPDWASRAGLYNLYHLLNHLNLFGESYLAAVQSVLQRYGRTG